MKLNYSGKEQVEATPEQVWAFVQDPDKVARCLPEVQEVSVHDAQHMDAVVMVGVGMVRGRFKFRIELNPDPAAGRVTVKVSGGGLGSAVDLTAGADVLPGATPGTTTLDWQGEATMRGPLASVGGRLLDSQAKKLIEQTFANMSANIRSGVAGASSQSG